MSFSILNSTIILCSSNTLIIYNDNEGETITVKLPDLQSSKPNQHHNNVDIDSFHGITSVTFSNDGEYFCVCTNRKQLCLYRTQQIQLIANRTLMRAASKVRFTPKNDVIVADKSGDAYVYSTSRPEEPGQLILGHLSMLLDILVTDDDNYVITADRDEKIRVSHYPNAYSIETFCLGHRNFVSNISLLPHERNILISSGGDGEFKLWDYRRGIELKCVNFMDHVEENYLKNLNDNLKEWDLQETVTNLPVKHMRVERIDDNKSILINSFYGAGIILVYEIFGLEVNYLQTIIEDNEPLECIICDRKFSILFDCGIRVYKFDKIFILESSINDSLNKLNAAWRELGSKAHKQMFYPILYKRKFDNVQEYQERKQSRMKLSK